MDLRLAELAAAQQGLVVTPAALTAGVTKAQLSWAVRQGQLVRVARGAYVRAEDWAGAQARQRHLFRLRAALALSPRSVAIAESAAIVWGLPLPAVPDLPRLLLPRSDGHSGGGRGHRPHALGRKGWLPEEEIGVGPLGIRVTAPARTVVDCTRHLDRPWSLAVADAARRFQGVRRGDLLAAAKRNPCAPGHAAAVWVAERAVRWAESPLESLARAVVVLAGLPEPRPQVWLQLPGGDVRVDLLDPGGRVIIEADGRLKYTHPQALWQEKLREDALRATGREVLRFTFQDYLRPDPWLCRYRTALLRTYGEGSPHLGR